MLLLYGCGLAVSSDATVRLRVGNEQCCYHTVAVWLVDLNKDVAVAPRTVRFAKLVSLATPHIH